METDIIRWAREVDPVTALLLDRKAPQGMDHETFVWFLERFAALVAAAEREACAVAAWSTGMGLHMKAHDAREIGSACAAAIRARNNVQQETQSKD